MSNGPSRPWFGPKRIGYGLRPQTWQGWAIVLAVVAVVIAIAVILGH
jgi:ABC-type dipeptide/oligopeptide/nickel transport system permease subunit